MMAYVKCVPSLKEMATFKVAINLCQDASFKEAILIFKKPTHYPDERSFCIDELEVVDEWDKALDKQCHRLTQELPQSLQQGIHIWMSRIAYEYLSYAKRMESLFGMSPKFFMNIVSQQDWTGSCHLNEKKLAKRILRDERLTVLQQYRVACVYCLHRDIPYLWNSLPPEQKQSITGSHGPSDLRERNEFVLLWSCYMDGRREDKVTGKKNSIWIYAMQLAVKYGNRTIFMQCWKRLNKNAKKQSIINWANTFARIWMDMQNIINWKEDFIFDVYHSYDRPVEHPKHFNLPHYYSELVHILLSKMHKNQQLKFFEKAFGYNLSCNPGLSILNGFLDWPLQDYFLSTLRGLWGVIPKGKYVHFLLSVARKYSDEEENSSHNYCSILWNLWKETPEEYKEYVLSYRERNNLGGFMKPVIEHLLPLLLRKTPFKNKDAELFKHVWQDVPQELKKAMVIDMDNRNNISRILVEKGMWSSLNGLLEEFLSNTEIPNFKQKIIDVWGFFFCWINFENNNEEYVIGFINWAFESDTDKKQFKYDLFKKDGVLYCSYLLEQGKINEIELIINFCLSSEEMKSQFKAHVVKETCCKFLKDFAWEEMDKYIALVFDTEEKIFNFKKDFFNSYSPAIDTIHHDFIFYEGPHWEKIEKFYQWFCLSSEEIKKT